MIRHWTCCALACLVALAAMAVGAVEPLERPADAGPVLIEIDARSVHEIGRWPCGSAASSCAPTRLERDGPGQDPAADHGRWAAAPPGMTEIPHTAVIELEAAILGAEVIAFLMQPDTDGRHFERFIALVRNYFHGKGGDTPTKGALKEAANIQKAYDEYLARLATGKAIRKNSILVAMLAVYGQARELALTGDPDRDWRAMRRLLEGGGCPRLKELAQEVRNIRVLERGTQLRQALSLDWRDNGAYRDALAIIRQAFVQEHFSTNAKPETGVVVMNMHKAKGKQFDEVIIFEGWPIKRKGQPPYNADRIVRFNSRDQIDDQVRQNLRVSVTRGKRHTTILTPKSDPCILLRNTE